MATRIFIAKIYVAMFLYSFIWSSLSYKKGGLQRFMCGSVCNKTTTNFDRGQLLGELVSVRLQQPEVAPCSNRILTVPVKYFRAEEERTQLSLFA